MPYILGGNGFIKFKRGSSVSPLPATVDQANVNTILNRVGIFNWRTQTGHVLYPTQQYRRQIRRWSSSV
jgi:hypothetical protein